MAEEFDIVTTTDAVFFRDNQALTVYDYLDGIDAVLVEISKSDDMEIGINVLRSLVASVAATGKSLAKLLHGMSKLWKSDNDFLEYVGEFVHISPTVVSRYIDAWDAYTMIPKEYQETFLLRPMKDLNALGAAMSQGFAIENWEKLSKATSNSEFLQCIREEKGVAPRKNSLTIFLEDSGDLVGWIDGKRINVGYLNIKDIEDDPMLEKAIKRIVNSSGILNH